MSYNEGYLGPEVTHSSPTTGVGGGFQSEKFFCVFETRKIKGISFNPAYTRPVSGTN